MIFSLDKEILHNIVDATKYEWLESNGTGYYASTTCVGMNTRREHGLFVVPDRMFSSKVVLLSKFEESIFIENRLHEISTNQYSGGIFPQGFKYLERFEINPFPRFTYVIEDRVIQKTVFALNDKPLVVVRYELKNQGNPIDLIVKPFIADRLSNELGSETQGLNTDSYRGQQFVRWAPKTNMPELYVFFDKGEYVTATLWYHNFYYTKDAGKYPVQSEDLFNPGFFQVLLRPYESLNLYISSRQLDVFDTDFESLYRQEASRRAGAKKFFNNHRHLASFERNLDQALIRHNNKPFISISNLEHGLSVRDMLFAIPGALFLTKRFDFFKELYHLLLSKLDKGLLPVRLTFGSNGVSYGSIDASLWLIVLGYQYYKLTEDKAFITEDLYEALFSVFDNYNKGTSFNIFCDKDGLISCGDKNTSLSWIPLKKKDGNVLRYGKLVEVNALWYNVLQIMEIFAGLVNKRRWASKFRKQHELCKKSFDAMFLNEDRNAFFDFVNPEEKNTEFRINQVIPLMLPFQVIENNTAQRILQQVDARLLTPYGLRARELTEESAVSNTPVILHRMMADYYNRAIWPWSVYLYVEAFTRVYQNAKFEAKQKHEYFESLFSLVQEGVIGYLPEAISMDGEIFQSGIMDYTPAMSGVLWAFFKLIVKMRS